MHIVYMVALAVTSTLALVGIFSRQYGDNLFQRIGLSIIGFASCVDLILLLDFDNSCCQAVNVKTLFIIGAAIYGIGTYIKVHRYKGATS